jgi:hypothetical protein
VISSRFLRFAAICAFVTVLTTLAIHRLPPLWASANTFEEQLGLRDNPIYLARLWVVIVHCILVVISMYAVGALRVRRHTSLMVLGFLGFVVFAVAELLRTSLAIFAVNRRWREEYATTADAARKEALRAAIEAFPGIGSALFFLFAIGFQLGLLCYGLALLGGQRMDRVLGGVFLLWVLLSLPGMFDTITGSESVSRYFEWVGPDFQPLARALVGIWLWRESRKAPQREGMSTSSS